MDVALRRATTVSCHRAPACMVHRSPDSSRKPATRTSHLLRAFTLLPAIAAGAYRALAGTAANAVWPKSRGVCRVVCRVPPTGWR
jgi:hypothetical protein